MEVFKCTKCGTHSPLKDANGQLLSKDRQCFRCGSKEKVKVTLPNFAPTKKGRRSRFRGHRIIRIGS